MFNPKIAAIKEQIAALEAELKEAQANPDFTPEDLFLYFFPLGKTKVEKSPLSVTIVNEKNYISFSTQDRYVLSESQEIKDSFAEEYGMNLVQLSRCLTSQIQKYFPSAI